MPQVRERIHAYGQKKYNTNSMRKTLQLLKKDGLSDKKLAKMFGGTVPAIRHWLKKLNLLKPRPRFPEMLKQQGYPTLRSFFAHPKNYGKSFKELAKETGYCYVTVSYWYHVFEKETGFERG